ncbi:DUF3408 domain-containing protein [Flavobacterium sp. UBA6031]|uniref:DUF3408 domain-containing protein n=1 Tax=Flavobacterium sp. UBA6031 TaxID=1946551 RepID=UPI0025C16DF4|nr:DUF3408 domain-containing protein [Flavobacterium sp. UBA6031]
MAKQTTIPKVDEDFMREVISQGFPMKKESLKEKNLSVIIKEDKPSVKTPKTKDTPTRKRIEQTDYREIYFEKINLSDRQQVSISRETHLTLFNVVNMVGGHKATISSYIENIILQHLKSHKEEINELYETQYKKPIL